VAVRNCGHDRLFRHRNDHQIAVLVFLCKMNEADVERAADERIHLIGRPHLAQLDLDVGPVAPHAAHRSRNRKERKDPAESHDKTRARRFSR
jgi:hypothetical protein